MCVRIKKIFKNDEGTAAIEIMFVAPIIALFIVVAIQIAAVFHGAFKNLILSDENASKAIIQWEKTAPAFLRPCIDEIYPSKFTHEGNSSIGVEPFKIQLNTNQEVYIVAKPICSD